MANVTYLFGAGASAEALPPNLSSSTSWNLGDALNKLAFNLQDPNGYLLDISPSNVPFSEKLVANLRWLSNESKKHDSIDSYANYLYVNKKPELEILKKTLSFYFAFEQVIAKRFDKRVRNFFNKMLVKGPKFRENVKLITWNYDFQIELAANESFQEHSNGSNKHISLIQYYPPLYYGPVKDTPNNYVLVHMNGIAGHLYKQDSKKINPIVNENILDINSLLEWEQREFKNDNILTFAWENDKEDPKDTMGIGIREDSMEIAETIAKQTEVLVIIGYSFPFFNREYDMKIIQTMKNNIPTFKKIYIQDPILNDDFLDKQFNIRQTVPVKIEHIKDCGSYFIPPELKNPW